MKTFIDSLIKNSCHAELDSASHSVILSGAKNLKSAPSLTLPLGEGTGFTLAETLITLGIIGVVAVLVLPNVINHFKVKQLEAQFKRADNILSQAFIKTFNEFGYMNPIERTPKGPYNDDLLNQMKEDVKLYNEVWLKQFPKIKEVNWYKLQAKKIYCHYLFGQEASSGAGCYFPAGIYNTSLYILPNGVAVSPLYVSDSVAGGWPGMIGYIFDSNGPFKGPNRWGHDIFNVYANAKEYRNYCNPTISNTYNLQGCYWYAHSNVNPNPLVEKSKDYWDILYKPESYWKN